MDYQEKAVLLKNGKTCVLRLAEESEAEMLLEYLKVTSAQTPCMAREPEELDVVSANAPAVGLYQKLGFMLIGTMPRALKYKDGSYADFLLMVKQL